MKTGPLLFMYERSEDMQERSDGSRERSEDMQERSDDIFGVYYASRVRTILEPLTDEICGHFYF